MNDGVLMEIDSKDLKRDVEALLFAAGRPLSVEELARALSSTPSAASGEATTQPGTTQKAFTLEESAVESVLETLAAEFPVEGERGFELVRLAGGWAFRTNPRCRAVVTALFDLPEDVTRLSAAAMESLAIIAYLQPVSRPQVAEVRGVNSDSPIRTLVERELITELGRDKTAGGAVLYGTTARFEAMFGLAGLEDLPALEGFALRDEQKEDLTRRLGLMTIPE